MAELLGDDCLPQDVLLHSASLFLSTLEHKAADYTYGAIATETREIVIGQDSTLL